MRWAYVLGFVLSLGCKSSPTTTHSDAGPPGATPVTVASAPSVAALEAVLVSPDASAAEKKRAHEILDRLVREPRPKRSEDEERRSDATFRQGSGLVGPYLVIDGKAEKPPNRADLERGIALLESVTTDEPRNWAAHWVIGKAYQALDRHDAAYDALKRAAEVNPYHPDVAREEALALMILGRGRDAVVVAQRATKFNPDDAGLVANLALAELLAGDVAEAERTAARAQRAAPNDAVTANVAKLIADVKAGKRPRPDRLPEN